MLDQDEALTGVPRARPAVSDLVRTLRPHQWAKNALVLVPLLAAHRAGDLHALARTALAFVAFGLVASSVYVVNDLSDVEADRLHPRKRRRPIASGAVSPRAAVLLLPALLAAAAACCWLVPPPFALVLAGYAALSVAYSLGLKRRAPLDVLTLAALYTARIFAGGFAAQVPVSEWMASFSIFLFLSLALLKRAAELQASEAAPAGRGYRPADRETLLSLGTASAYLSVLVLALYVSSHEVRRLYPRPAVLWGLCPVLLHWLTRMWLLARRGEVDDDPLVFAMKDRATYAAAAVGAALVIAAAWPAGAP